MGPHCSRIQMALRSQLALHKLNFWFNGLLCRIIRFLTAARELALMARIGLTTIF